MAETLNEQTHPKSPAPNQRLAGRCVVITGAASGIGRSVMEVPPR